MSRTSGTGWMSDNDHHGYDEPEQTSDDFEFNQRGKPLKAVIGVAVLVVLALVLSRMNPTPHEAANPPSITTGQSTNTESR